MNRAFAQAAQRRDEPDIRKACSYGNINRALARCRKTAVSVAIKDELLLLSLILLQLVVLLLLLTLLQFFEYLP